MIDAIVFTQNELDNAVRNGARNIVLCDNNFVLPPAEDVKYTHVGRVNVHNGDTAKIKTAPADRVSRVSSYSSSYKLTSYRSSYRFSGSYRSFKTSYRTSFFTSYRYSYEYKTAGSGSYLTSYRLSGSYSKSSSLLSFIHLFKHRLFDRALKEISVNGYGIHLI